MNHFPAKNLGLLLLTSIIWGTGFVAQAVGMDHLGPFAFNASRSFVGGVALIPVILFFGRFKSEERRAEERANRKTLLIGGLCCGLALGVASCLQQVGMQYTTVGKAGFITAMYIVIVPILGLFFHKSGREALGQRGHRHFWPVPAVHERLVAAPEGRPAGVAVCPGFLRPHPDH